MAHPALLPLTEDGLGAGYLRPADGRRWRWADLIDGSDVLRTYQRPQLDIVTCFPDRATLTAIDAASGHVMTEGMTASVDPVFLSVLRVEAEALGRRHPEVMLDAAGGRILRSVLMKPEHETYLADLHTRVAALSRPAQPTSLS